jgi:nucleotide-binding universal stress UspA family protein
VTQSGAQSPAHAIAEVAREERSDLVVMGTRGHTALAGVLLGSVTQRLLHIAPCPVLVVPRD